MTIGCDKEDEDHRVAEIAMRATEQQSKQNVEAAQLQRETADSHRRIVEATEASRQAIRSLEKDLQAHRTAIDEERKLLANERRRESLLSTVLSAMGPLLLASLPLVICLLLLLGLRSSRDETSSAATELLMQQLDADQLRLPISGSNPPRVSDSNSSQSPNEQSPRLSNASN